MEKDYIMQIISAKQEEREAKKIFPYNVPIGEIKNAVCADLMDALRYMCKSGELECHRTINGFSISIRS